MSKIPVNYDLSHNDLVFGTEKLPDTADDTESKVSDDSLRADLLYSFNVEPVEDSTEDLTENFSDDLVFKPAPEPEKEEDKTEDFSSELIYQYRVKPVFDDEEPGIEEKRRSIDSFKGIIYDTKAEPKNDDYEENLADDKMSESFRQITLDDVIALIKEKIQNGGKVTFTPSGTSMLPMLRDSRDIVVLKKPDGRLHLYDIALYRRENGSYVLHRVVDFEGNGSYIMRGDNQFENERDIKHEAVIAVVCAYYRGGHQHSMQSLGYLAYKTFWMNTTPVRYIIRRVKNKIVSILVKLGIVKPERKKAKKKKKKDY